MNKAYLWQKLGTEVQQGLTDPQIVEVMLNPDGSLWFKHKSKGNIAVNCQSTFSSAAFVHALAQYENKFLNAKTPYLNAVLPFQGERINVTILPITDGISFNIRVWHIDKQLFGQRFCESTGTASLAEAELYLARRIEELRQRKIFGVRPTYTFDEAAKKYVSVKKSKISIHKDIRELKRLHDYLAGQPLESIHMGNAALQRFIEDRKNDGVKHRTINFTLQVLRHLLKLAAEEWRDEKGNTWLMHVPKIKLLPEKDARKPRPITWEEQNSFFPELSPMLRQLALFAVNTGCRDQEFCQLQWQWEVLVPELKTSIFVLPGWYHQTDGRLIKFTKNGEDRLVVLNRIAKGVVDRQRNNQSSYVFARRHNNEIRPYHSMNTNGWQLARKRAGIPDVRVHDLRHTFGRRLRSAGVRYEDRQDLLGHKSGRITTHYSAAEIGNLITAVSLICEQRTSAPILTVIRGGVNARSRKSPARQIKVQ